MPTLPKKWWQWILLYPTLLISLGGNIPHLLTGLFSYNNDVPFGQVQSAKSQRDAWVRNKECIRQTTQVYSVTTPENVIIRLGACQATGDVLVEVNYPDGTSNAKWLEFESLKNGSEITQFLEGVSYITNATAMEYTPKKFPRIYKKLKQMSESKKPHIMVDTGCQVDVAKRYIFRRVSVPVQSDNATDNTTDNATKICFEEIVDTLSGDLLIRQKGECDNPCNEAYAKSLFSHLKIKK